MSSTKHELIELTSVVTASAIASVTLLFSNYVLAGFGLYFGVTSAQWVHTKYGSKNQRA